MPTLDTWRDSITSTLANTMYVTVGIACFTSRKTVEAYEVVRKEGKAFVGEVKEKYQSKRNEDTLYSPDYHSHQDSIIRDNARHGGYDTV